MWIGRTCGDRGKGRETECCVLVCSKTASGQGQTFVDLASGSSLLWGQRWMEDSEEGTI